MSNPIQYPGPWNNVSAGYQSNVMPFLAQYSKDALALLNLQSHERVLDVACGPGTLTLQAATQASQVTAIDFAAEMIAKLQTSAREMNLTNVLCKEGDGQNLDLDDESFDAAFSMFGLMFFPDRAKGFSELHRVLVPGGRVAVSSWIPSEDSPLMRTISGALQAAKPDLPPPPTVPPGLEDHDVFKAELRAAGFTDITIHTISHDCPPAGAEDFWSSMTTGNVFLDMLRRSLDESTWDTLCQKATAHLHETFKGQTPIFSLTAYLAIAKKPLPELGSV